jgi:lipoate---protein ligase
VRQVRLVDAGSVPAVRSQTVYHAAAHAMGPKTPDTIIVVSPADPYVCIGFHQDVEQEVDLAYCAEHGLPVLRREVGGGAVYLDAGQVFLQWVFHEPSLPAELEAQFELYIRPLVETYRAFGIAAELRPVNDVHVAGKKIGGTGAAQIGAARVLVGSFMFDFDKRTMARVLKVPSEKMRDKIFASLEEYMTTMREQLPELPARRDVLAAYVERCAEALDAEIVPGAWTPEEEAEALRLDERFRSREWIHRKGRDRGGTVKIHEDVRVVEGALKAPGGLIRVTATLHDHRIDDLGFSGDFTLLPASGLVALEDAVRGVAVDEDQLTRALDAVYRDLELRSPGLEPAHFAEAIVRAAAG